MRAATTRDSQNVEKQTFDVSKIVRVYFNDVVHVEGFILAVDETGVFFFTDSNNHDNILVKLSNYMEQLDLEKKDIVVCQLTWSAESASEETFFKLIPEVADDDVFFISVNPDTFETAIRLILSHRKPIFSKEDVIEITECFQKSYASIGTLYEYLKQRGFNLEKDSVDAFESIPMITLSDVVHEFGKEHAEEIFKAMQDFRDTRRRELERSFPREPRYKRTSWESSATTAKVLSFICFVAACVMCIARVPGLVIIFSIMGILQARHLALIYKTMAATILTWLNLATFLFGVMQLVAHFKPEIIQFLQNTLLISR